MKIFKHHIPSITLSLFVAEAFVLIASVYIGAALRFYGDNFLLLPKFDHFFWLACFFSMVMLFSMSLFGMYRSNYREDTRNILLRLMPSFLLGFVILTSFFYLLPNLDFGRGVLGIVIIVAFILLLLVRTIFYHTYEFGLIESRILFLGCGSLARECSELAMNNINHHNYKIAGFVKIKNEKCQVRSSSVLSREKPLIAHLMESKANEIIVAVDDRREGNFPIQQLLQCKLNGIKVTDASSFFEREAFQIRVDTLQPSWLIYGSGFDQSFWRAFVKRIVDLFSSILILLVAFPFMLITAICIYIEDRSPIFYKQERVGRNGRTFMVLKFRSMRNDAEKGIDPQWATNNDPRITRVGKIIRKLRIDELPQIFNVCVGDMSFVGPRPERPFFVQQLNEQIPFYNVRHSIKPGITGLAQVRYQYGSSVEDSLQKLQYDLYYVKNNSWFLDVLILIDTFQVVLLGKGQ